MRRARHHGGWIAAVAVFALTALARALGLLQTLEFSAADARARLLSHEVETDVVIVGIDARSLAALDRWPWPRRHHAELLARLSAAKPRRVFLDIDFSARSNALDDAVLDSALASWPGEPVILPVFFQASTAADATPQLSRPLERFLPHVALAAVNRRPGEDGLERAWRSDWSVDGRRFHSVIDLEGRLPAGSQVPIDYAISPASFVYLSFVDLLEGRVAPEMLAGKTVFVGATAVELGDMVPVPIHRSLPGVVVQALALESVRAGPQRGPPEWLFLGALAAWTLAAAAAFRARSWRRNAALCAVAIGLVAAASVYLEGTHRLVVEVVPFAVATAGAFLALVLRSLDLESWRAVTYALGMRRKDALLRSIVQSSTDCIISIDPSGAIRTANPAAEALFDCPARELLGAPIARFIPPLAVAEEDESRVLAVLDGRVTEWEATTHGGRVFPVELSVSRVHLPGERLYTAIARDISERKVQQRRLEYQATHDALTRLPNRGALMQRLERALGSNSGGGDTVTLFMLDLCRFKEVNDTLGHGVGDEVLCEVARRFSDALGNEGFIARIGGDEFTVLLERTEAQAAADALAQRLADGLKRPIDVAGVSLEVGLSIGIARSPQDATDAETLLKHADVAMFVAKRRGTAFEHYDAALDDNSVRRLSLGGELRAAIARDALDLHYQPKVSLRTGRAESVEALLRWHHPVHGSVNPAEFIAFAESTDLIRPLTEWTLRRALRDGSTWRRAGIDARIAVNLSARLLQDTAFPATLRALLDAAGADAASLELEITESAMMADPARALRIVREIDRIGVVISIDDFGTGYSSLGYLRDLPVRALKLDKSFVTGMRAHAGDRVIVESTVKMAHALRLEVVAEGVESEWDARFLAVAGYDHAQGYLYSRALPAAECAEWIERHNRACLRTGTHAC